MMKIIGLTGGIGAGKSTVARIFEEKGYPVYNSDNKAKSLMETDEDLKQNIQKLLGKESYLEGKLNKKYIAEKIFSDKELLKQQNRWVHEAVRKDFSLWVQEQKTVFCLKETAILFESGAYKSCNLTILVTASEEVRIKRVMERDNMERTEVVKRMNNQWKQEELMKLADYCVNNEGNKEDLELQVQTIISKIL